MSAFSTISALRRRRPEGLPEGNAAAGGGLQGVACRERLAGGGLPGAARRGGLAGGGLLGAPCRERLAGGASQGAPRRGRWRTATPSEGCSRFWLSAPTRSGPTSPATGRLSGLSSPQGTSPLRSVAPPPERPLPPARLHFGDAPPPPHARNHATSQPRNLATSQPRNHATTQPRSLRNPSATQKGPSPRGESPFASGWRRAPIRGTRAGYRLQRPNRRRRPRWDPWRASAGSCSGPPSAPQSARRGQPSEPPKHRPNQSAG